MIDPSYLAVGGTLLVGGGFRSLSAYLRYRNKAPELTSEEKLVAELMAPLNEPEKTLPEHCDLFVERIFERRLLDAGVIRKDEMSVCSAGLNCVECRPTVEYKNSLANVRREREQREHEVAEKALAKKQAQNAEAARARKYHNERWQAVTTDTGRVKGYIHEIGNGAWEFEASGSGKKRILSAAEARRYCKACWSGLQRGVCPRQCPQPVAADRKRSVQGHMVHVPEDVPFDAYGKLDRDYTSSRFFSVMWKWINPDTGKHMTVRSIHPKAGSEDKKPNAIDRASHANTQYGNVMDIEGAHEKCKCDDYEHQMENYDRRIRNLDRKW